MSSASIRTSRVEPSPNRRDSPSIQTSMSTWCDAWFEKTPPSSPRSRATRTGRSTPVHGTSGRDGAENELPESAGFQRLPQFPIGRLYRFCFTTKSRVPFSSHSRSSRRRPEGGAPSAFRRRCSRPRRATRRTPAAVDPGGVHTRRGRATPIGSSRPRPVDGRRDGRRRLRLARSVSITPTTASGHGGEDGGVALPDSAAAEQRGPHARDFRSLIAPGYLTIRAFPRRPPPVDRPRLD